jgi:nucleotide-binding universal stress UspA family protein
VVVGVDGSTGARGTLRTALLEAARRHGRLGVVAAYRVVLPWTGGSPVVVPDRAAVREDTRKRARMFPDQVSAELRAEEVLELGGVSVDVGVAAGSAAAVLVEQAESADLLVVGGNGGDEVRSSLLGSVAPDCVTHARCPLMVIHAVPGPRPAKLGPVVVGVDGSDTSIAALREAVAKHVGWAPTSTWSWPTRWPTCGPTCPHGHALGGRDCGGRAGHRRAPAQPPGRCRPRT